MTDEEVDQIIAEFMGLDYPEHSGYTKSLDKLVLPWRKLNTIFSAGMSFRMDGDQYGCLRSFHIGYALPKTEWKGMTEPAENSIRQAAARATAKVIKEVDSEKE